MAHPKSRISKQRGRKGRTHYKAIAPNVSTCKVTGETYISHHAYVFEGDLYYGGKLIVKGFKKVRQNSGADTSED